MSNPSSHAPITPLEPIREAIVFACIHDDQGKWRKVLAQFDAFVRTCPMPGTPTNEQILALRAALLPFANAHHRLREYGAEPPDTAWLCAWSGEAGHAHYELLDGELGPSLTVGTLAAAAAALAAPAPTPASNTAALRDALAQADHLYSHGKLVANDVACGHWIDNVRALLRASTGESRDRHPKRQDAAAPLYTKAEVIEAWACLRRNNHSISDECLDQMRAVLLAQLDSGNVSA